MNMLCKAIIAAALALITGPSLAVELSVNTMDSRVLPVFVQVNSEGEVTRILPAEQLTPKFNRMLDEAIRSWIKKPAMVNGHAVNSSMIMRVSLNVQPRSDGNYDLFYHYISTTATPMASASSYWKWTNNNLALVTDSDELRDHRHDIERRASDAYPATYDRGSLARMASQTSAGSRASSNSSSRSH
ncbi:hypothetical protein [Dyella acidisoli]|uniref:Uncharacterized protein n=1 Tax=Dyella acidisoli TaxID=1867834 RepID=A0ABQ5XNI2_9GAMM|nr:hypothetical protein [Dyella acidisoli]GLQ92791.1 hypothetical protein GCM10007901_17420 [Dyella acidisoli]